MRKLLFALLLLVDVCVGQTYYRRDDYVTNAQGQAVPNVAVTYYAQPWLTLASVYSSASGGATGNPQYTDGFGHAVAYMASGTYTITYSGPTIQTVTLADQVVGGAGGSSGVTSINATTGALTFDGDGVSQAGNTFTFNGTSYPGVTSDGASGLSIVGAVNGVARVLPSETSINAVEWGDSLIHNTGGGGSTIVGYASVMPALNGRVYSIVDCGYSGAHVDVIASHYTDCVLPYKPATTGKPAIIFLDGGSNDYLSGTDVATVESTLATMFAEAHADGFLIVMATVAAREDVLTNWYYGRDQTVRVPLNAWIRAQYVAGAFDYLMDWDALVQNPEDPNTTIDGVHFTKGVRFLLGKQIDSALGGNQLGGISGSSSPVTTNPVFAVDFVNGPQIIADAAGVLKLKFSNQLNMYADGTRIMAGTTGGGYLYGPWNFYTADGGTRTGAFSTGGLSLYTAATSTDVFTAKEFDLNENGGASFTNRSAGFAQIKGDSQVEGYVNGTRTFASNATALYTYQPLFAGALIRPQTDGGADLGAASFKFGTIYAGALANGITATTQTALDNSTKVSTTAYTNAAVAVETARATGVEATKITSPAGTSDIAANAVTLAKQASNTANSLQGFDNSGNAADVSVGSGLSLSGGILTSSAGSPSNLVNITSNTTASCNTTYRMTSGASGGVTLTLASSPTTGCTTSFINDNATYSLTIASSSPTILGSTVYTPGQVGLAAYDGTHYVSTPADSYTGLTLTHTAGGGNAIAAAFQSLTTTGSSGAATLSGGVLNIPQYTGSGLSGMTSGQVAVAATASTVTSSKAIQGTDSSLLSSGTVSGTGATLCTDANGGATTSGCSTSVAHTIIIPISNGTSPIVTGQGNVGPPSAPSNFSCTINSAKIVSPVSGSITVDVWKAASAIPTSGGKISASAPVTLSSAAVNTASSLSGWTTSVSANDVLWATVATVDGVLTNATVQLGCQ